jgi:hypothetical protein
MLRTPAPRLIDAHDREVAWLLPPSHRRITSGLKVRPSGECLDTGIGRLCCSTVKLTSSRVDPVADTLTDAIPMDDGNLVIDLSSVQFNGAAAIGVPVRGRTVLPRQMIRLPIVTAVSFTGLGDPTARTQHRAQRRAARLNCAR